MWSVKVYTWTSINLQNKAHSSSWVSQTSEQYQSTRFMIFLRSCFSISEKIFTSGSCGVAYSFIKPVAGCDNISGFMFSRVLQRFIKKKHLKHQRWNHALRKNLTAASQFIPNPTNSINDVINLFLYEKSLVVVVVIGNFHSQVTFLLLQR